MPVLRTLLACLIVPFGAHASPAHAAERPNFLQNNPYGPLELYDLQNDPQEKNDLAAKNKQLVNELGTALRAHVQRGGATPWQKPPR